jgi:hypothetical protein
MADSQDDANTEPTADSQDDAELKHDAGPQAPTDDELTDDELTDDEQLLEDRQISSGTQTNAGPVIPRLPDGREVPVKCNKCSRKGIDDPEAFVAKNGVGINKNCRPCLTKDEGYQIVSHAMSIAGEGLIQKCRK